MTKENKLSIALKRLEHRVSSLEQGLLLPNGELKIKPIGITRD